MFVHDVLHGHPANRLPHGARIELGGHKIIGGRGGGLGTSLGYGWRAARQFDAVVQCVCCLIVYGEYALERVYYFGH